MDVTLPPIKSLSFKFNKYEHDNTKSSPTPFIKLPAIPKHYNRLPQKKQYGYGLTSPLNYYHSEFSNNNTNITSKNTSPVYSHRVFCRYYHSAQDNCYAKHNNENKDSEVRQNWISIAQTQTLESIFQRLPFPSKTVRKNLASHLNIPPKTIQVWFQNKRQAEKKSFMW